MTTESKPTEKQDSKANQTEDITSHEYDGIKELNNPPPYWITLIFLASIAFSMFYVIHFHGYPGNGKDQKSEYEQKVAAFEKKKAAMRKEAGGGIELSASEILAAGAKLYTDKGCMACHGLEGEGNIIGPNLTDNYWINGCSEEEVTTMIREGKPEKGMTPYKNVMTDEHMEHLTQYILQTMIGSEPANPKDPQGEECQ
ncbi:MAG: c-type cytochrome [Bacteroidales bacterium]|nr:c-type cytochrome [Bacteroidales bacterium]